MRTNAARLGFRRRQSPASITSCCGEGDFSLPKPGQRRDPGLEIAGIWRMPIKIDREFRWRRPGTSKKFDTTIFSITV
jgi:hypothetical protein